jgi:glycine cleavage system regulatory protein
VPEDHVEDLVAERTVLESSGLRIVAEPCDNVCKSKGVRRFYLELVGQGRPGIVRDITKVLAKHHANSDELDARCQEAEMSGETLFMTKAHISLPAKASLVALYGELEDLANEPMVDIKLEE